MTEAAGQSSKGKSPLFYGGLMFAAYGTIAGLAMTGAIEGKVTLLLMMLAPMGLLFPLIKAANRRIDDGGNACMGKGEAQKRYTKRIGLFTSLYLIAMALFVMVQDDGQAAVALKSVFAVLPGLAIVGVFWAIGRLIVEETDEFLRMLVIRQSLIATAVALGAASIWGFLESAEIVIHLDAYWWAVAWFFGLFIGAVMNRIEYGTWGAV